MRALIVAFVLCLATSGCINVGPSEELPEMRFYAIDPVRTGAEVGRGARTIALRPVTGPRRYEERVVRRLESGRVEFLEFDRWAETPEQGLERATLAALLWTGKFDAVVLASIDVDAQLMLDAYIVACDVVGSMDAPQAQLTLWFVLSDNDKATLLDSRTATAKLPIPGPGLDGLGPTMAACASEVVDQVVAEWEKRGLLK
jgi:ABC-type uncharacterized transport system auxiliary subunit